MGKLNKVLLFLTLTLTPAALAAETPMSVYGSDDEERESRAGGFAVRAGVGSLFGPAFEAGQPRYAHSDGFDWENRAPFKTPHQVVTTFGLAASLTIGVGNWAVGPTIVGGFNATQSSSNALADISLSDSLTGTSFGGGLHASRSSGPLRLTLDVLGSYSSLRGELEWSYADFFGSETLVGAGEWHTSYLRVATLAGVELDVGPAFIFLNAGAQFLPRQQRQHHLWGSYPEAHTNQPFNVAIVSEVRNKGRATVTFEEELSFAASAGIGLRF